MLANSIVPVPAYKCACAAVTVTVPFNINFPPLVMSSVPESPAVPVPHVKVPLTVSWL